MKDNTKYRNWLHKQGVEKIQTQMAVEPNEKVYLFKDLAMARAFENTYFKAATQPSKIQASNDRFRGFHRLAISPEQEAILKRAREDLDVNPSKVVIYSAAVKAEEGCKAAFKFNDSKIKGNFIQGFVNVMGEDEASDMLSYGDDLVVYINNNNGTIKDKGFDYGSVEHNGSLAINCGMSSAAEALRHMMSLTGKDIDLQGNLIIFNPDRLPLVADKKSNIVANFQDPIDNRCVKILRDSCERFDSNQLMDFLTKCFKEHTHTTINLMQHRSLTAFCGMMHGGDERDSYSYSIILSNAIRECVGPSFVDFVVQAEQSLGKL